MVSSTLHESISVMACRNAKYIIVQQLHNSKVPFQLLILRIVGLLNYSAAMLFTAFLMRKRLRFTDCIYCKALCEYNYGSLHLWLDLFMSNAGSL